jgi:hypothetical protein
MKKLIITGVVITAILAGTTTALAAQDNQSGFGQGNGDNANAVCAANRQCLEICVAGNDEANGSCLRECDRLCDGTGDCLCDSDSDGVCDNCLNEGACLNDGVQPQDGTGMQYGWSNGQGQGNQ